MVADWHDLVSCKVSSSYWIGNRCEAATGSSKAKMAFINK
jgi:hypothetical protein